MPFYFFLFTVQPSDPISFAWAGITSVVCTKVENNFWSGAVSYFIYGYTVYLVFQIITG